MKKMMFTAAMLIVSAALFTYIGCSGDDSPVSGGSDLMRVSRYDAEAYGPDSMFIYSGVDTCGATDANIQVTVPPLEAIWPALIGGGGEEPDCGCGVAGGIMEMAKPVTTHSQDDSLGVFETTFSLPAGITSPSMHLKVLADDGAEIYLNGYHIGTATLNGGLWEGTVSADSLFAYSEPCPPGGEPCSTLDMIRDHPLLGVGLDNFLYAYRGRYIRPAAWQEPNLSHPHNIILDFWSRLGLLGLAAGLWLQAAFWRLALPLRRLSGPGEPDASSPAERDASSHDERALALGLMGGMVDLLAHGLVDNSVFLVDLSFAFFLTLGLMVHLAGSRNVKTEPLPQPTERSTS